MQAPEDILRFWFEAHGPDDWFAGRPALDAEIAARFSDTHARVAAGEGYSWRRTPEGRLAEIIVLDQFSRQLFRGEARAYAQDGAALALAQETIAQGLDQKLPPDRRLFIYLPYEHSESLVIQAHAIRLFQSLGDEKNLEFARRHFEVIQRFGRFPRRNVALGRDSTPEEQAYIDSGEDAF